MPLTTALADPEGSLARPIISKLFRVVSRDATRRIHALGLRGAISLDEGGKGVEGETVSGTFSLEGETVSGTFSLKVEDGFLESFTATKDKETSMHSSFGGQASELVETRLRRLERQNRLLGWFAVASVVCFGVVAAMGAVRPQVPDKLEARQFVLLSAEGRVIGELGANEITGTPYFHLFNKKGSIGLALSDDQVQVCGKVGDGRNTDFGRIIMSRSSSGECSLLFRDDEGRSRLQIGVSKDNSPALEMWDRTLAERIRLMVDAKSDSPFITLGDGHTPRMVMRMSDGGAASLSLNDRKGGDAVRIEGGGQDGSGRIEMYDGQGKNRATLKVQAEGSPMLNFYGVDGKSRLELPNR